MPEINYSSSTINNLYGILKYSSQNIGDEIQSIAAMRFLPQIDYYLHRERLDQFHLNDVQRGNKVKLIMNAWWMWCPEHFPPSDDIDPLLISMHLREALHAEFARSEILDYFRTHGPVGCRDMSTKRFLDAQGVPAYFSGCLTLTLQGDPKFREAKGGGYILCVNLPEHLEEKVRNCTDRPVYNIDRMLSVGFTAVDRMKLAKCMLSLYHNAHCVVSSCLHAALPSIAFGTPVCLIKLNEKDGHSRFDGLDRCGRFDGLEDVFRIVTEDELLRKSKSYNFDDPPENPDKYLKFRDDLIYRCSEFTGYNDPRPLFEEGYEPLVELIKILAFDKKVIKRILRFASQDDLIKALYEKRIQKKSKHDLSF